MTAKKQKTEPCFSRDALLRAERFRHCRDLTMALIGPDETVTVSEAEKRLDSYLKGKVT